MAERLISQRAGHLPLSSHQKAFRDREKKDEIEDERDCEIGTRDLHAELQITKLDVRITRYWTYKSSSLNE